MTDKKLTLYTGAEEWNALYVDGKLERHGDPYWVDERIHQLAGVEEVYSADWLLGGDGSTGMAQTLDEVEEYRQRRVTAESAAAELRAHAEELRRRADELDGGRK